MNENKMKAPTNADVIKAMSTDELAAFLAGIASRGHSFIERADDYICRKCKKEHGGDCPAEDVCPFDMDELQTIKYWLEGESTD